MSYDILKVHSLHLFLLRQRMEVGMLLLSSSGNWPAEVTSLSQLSRSNVKYLCLCRFDYSVNFVQKFINCTCLESCQHSFIAFDRIPLTSCKISWKYLHDSDFLFHFITLIDHCSKFESRHVVKLNDICYCQSIPVALRIHQLRNRDLSLIATGETCLTIPIHSTNAERMKNTTDLWIMMQLAY